MVRKAARILIAVWLIATAQAALAEKRVALVIGNDRYPNLVSHAQLERARNDARAVSQAFRDLGFDVTEAEDVSRSAFNAKWQQFLLKVAEGDVVAFYFSGHGIEVEGLNFIIPSDIPNIDYGRQEQVKRESISVSELLLDLKKRRPGVSLLILDACREHPLIPDEFRSPGARPGGLAKMDAPNGTFIMYSAGAGQTALDRLPPPLTDPDSVDSVFTRKLLPLMRQKGVEIAELAREVRKQVHALAATVPHDQTPAYYDGVLGDFCLAGCSKAAQSAPDSGESSAVKKSGRLQDPEPERPKNPQVALVAPPKPSPEPQKPAISDGQCDGLLVSVSMSKEKPCIKPGSGQSFKDCPECPEMVPIPAGSFLMGSPEGEEGRSSCEGPKHNVTIPTPFAMGRTHITRRQFATFVKEAGYEIDSGCYVWTGNAWKVKKNASWRSPGFDQDDSHPVGCVNWNDAKAYVAWLAKTTGKPYRLLSEAEAEYAARGATVAGKMPRYSFGDDAKDLCRYANGADETAKTKFPAWTAAPCKDGYVFTAPAMSFKPNAFGLYDVHGNAWSWVEDCWHDSYAGAPGDGSAWTTGDCAVRVLRGGSWFTVPRNLRVAFRNRINAVDRGSGAGFRVARTLD